MENNEYGKYPFTRALIFDVDGTLCESGQQIGGKMIDMLNLLAHDFCLMVLGGGKYEKIKWQLGPAIYLFNCIMTENGIQTYDNKGNLTHEGPDLREYWGDAKLTKVVNSLMDYTVNCCDVLSVKTGKFIDLRKGLIYYCPIGQCVSLEDRANFVKFDEENDYRLGVMAQLRSYKHLAGLEMSLGGQLGISISPSGWDKSYLQKVVNIDFYKEVFFFGDKMGEGGSDAAVKKIRKVTCIAVASPDHTYSFLKRFKDEDYRELKNAWVIESSSSEEDDEIDDKVSGNVGPVDSVRKRSRRRSDLGIVPKFLLDES